MQTGIHRKESSYNNSKVNFRTKTISSIQEGHFIVIEWADPARRHNN